MRGTVMIDVGKIPPKKDLPVNHTIYLHKTKQRIKTEENLFALRNSTDNELKIVIFHFYVFVFSEFSKYYTAIHFFFFDPPNIKLVDVYIYCFLLKFYIVLHSKSFFIL